MKSSTTQNLLGASQVSTPKTRTRDIIVHRTATEWGTRNAPPADVFNTTLHSSGVLFSRQKTVSEGHPFHHLGKADADLGGEFFSERSFHWHNSPWLEVRSASGLTYSYFNGRVFPKVDASLSAVDGFAPVAQSPSSELDAAGTTAIARVIPTNPVAGMAVTLGELHEGFPKLMGTLLFKNGLKKILKGSGDEFLNYEFGIKPLINDLLKWAYAYNHADKLWDQFLRDSGRRVRRRYTFPESTELLESTVTPNQPAVGAGITASPSLWQGNSNSFTLYKETLLKRKRWFSGAFTYFVDATPDQRNQWKLHRRRLDYLYSTKITPQVLWNLAPWSWAADWFANTGDLITNMTRFSEDGLVMPYGYMMELSTCQTTYRMKNVTPKGYNIPDLTQVFRHLVKYRRQATPYGFGLNENQFSSRQWAILAALGLSRS
jgi:hypothetical protein